MMSFAVKRAVLNRCLHSSTAILIYLMQIWAIARQVSAVAWGSVLPVMFSWNLTAFLRVSPPEQEAAVAEKALWFVDCWKNQSECLVHEHHLDIASVFVEWCLQIWGILPSYPICQPTKNFKRLKRRWDWALQLKRWVYQRPNRVLGLLAAVSS